MDNLSVHKTPRVLDEMSKLNFIPIYNTIYSPQHNPIEMIFSKVKHHFKSLKTNAIVNKVKLDTEGLIKESFATVSKQDVCNCIQHSLRILDL